MPFQTKDSGKREEFESGMVRDTEEGKARFDLLFPLGIPYANQMLTRAADLMERGMTKYGERNWEKANSKEERDRAKSSAARHMIQWVNGEVDEDHAAAVIFNLIAAETITYKMMNLNELFETYPTYPWAPDISPKDPRWCHDKECFLLEKGVWGHPVSAHESWDSSPKIPQKIKYPSPICGAQCSGNHTHPVCNLTKGHTVPADHYHIASGSIHEHYWH